MATRESRQPQQVQIIGRVKSIKNRFQRDGNLFVVHAESINKDFTCFCEFFCPLAEDDVIYAFAVFTNSPQNTELQLTSPPFVQMAMDRHSVVRTFMKVFRGTGFGDFKANGLYDLFKKQAGGDDKDVIPFLGHLALKWYETRDIKLTQPYQGTGVITPTQLQKLLSWWHKQRNLRRLYLLGLNNKEISACEEYVDHLVDPDPKKLPTPIQDLIYQQCIENPYVLAPLSLDKCAQIWSRMGKLASDEDLLCAKVIRKVYELLQEKGWTCVPFLQLVSWFPYYLTVADRLADVYRLVVDQEMCYLSHPHRVETFLAEKIVHLVQNNPPPLSFDIVSFLSKTLSEDQKEAIRGAMNNRISIILGAAGTGKSSIIKEIVHNLQLRETSWMVTSFTGKAVARDREVLNSRVPSTMHRLIARKSQVPKFSCLIIDEAGMVSSPLLYEFLKTFDDTKKLIFVGDPNQLRPIEWGVFFEELVKSNVVPTFRLTTNHRSISTPGVTVDGIILNAQRIIDHHNGVPLKNPGAGEIDEDSIPPADEFDEYDDWDDQPSGPEPVQKIPFSFIPTNNFYLLDGDADKVVDLLRVLKGNGFIADQLAIICPYNEPLAGLNVAFQTIFNENPKMVVGIDGTLWRCGDRVVMTDNRYDIDVFNGDIGHITDLNNECVMVKFGDVVHTFKLFPSEKKAWNKDDGLEEDPTMPKGELTMQLLKIAYALTTHRCQGSEYMGIVAYIPKRPGSTSFVDAAMVYTFITRARQMLWCIANLEDLRVSAGRKAPARHDMLSKRIMSLMEQTETTE